MYRREGKCLKVNRGKRNSEREEENEEDVRGGILNGRGSEGGRSVGGE